MKDCLSNLTYLDAAETVQIMTAKLKYQATGNQFTWSGLNTLCWAIGSISGSLTEDEERRFLVFVIKELLSLCEAKRGKDNKAIIAANIMYVVGQHPRFLRAHWKFLKTVCNKLFEFMHESHEGVQDMACDTFLTIASECSHHFMATQPGEHRPFVADVIDQISSIIGDLSPQQTQTFYEALGRVIGSGGEDVNTRRRMLIEGALYLPNNAWEQYVMHARSNQSEGYRSHARVAQAINIIKLNRRACRAIGVDYEIQIMTLFETIVFVFEKAAVVIEEEARAALEQNPDCTLTSYGTIKCLRSLRHEILGLFHDWMNACEQTVVIERGNVRITPANRIRDCDFIDPLFELILPDYANAIHSDLREVEVLGCCSSYVRILGNEAQERVFQYLGSVFETTLQMINQNYEDYPEFRLGIFEFLLSVLRNSFSSLLRLTSTQFQFVYDSFIYALKHTDRNVIDLGFDCLIALFSNYEDLASKGGSDESREHALGFYRTYFLPTVDQIFTILNETSISTGLTQHTTLLMIMFRTLEELPFSINAEAIDGSGALGTGEGNVQLVKNHIGTGLKHAFPQLQEAQIKLIVEGFVNFDQDMEKLKGHIRDFLIEIRRHTGSDTSDLFLEEREQELASAAQEKEKRRRDIAASRGEFGLGNAADAVPLVDMEE
ncbi:hypothetical protein ACOME3_003629 [Neoechinorhynchus agilis]